MLNLPKFLFINGPAGSGKSTLARMICEAVPSAYRESFANPIRDMMYAVFFPEQDPFQPNLDLRDGATKKQEMPVWRLDEAPKTIRQAMISFSEDWMKPAFGDGVFGQLLYKRCEEQSLFYQQFVIDDSGFEREAKEVLAQVGPDSCILLRLHRDGCDFIGDSRSYITLPCRSIDLQNNGLPASMLDSLQLKLGNL